MHLPWIRLNHVGGRDNLIAFNRFERDAIPIRLRTMDGVTRTSRNVAHQVKSANDIDDASVIEEIRIDDCPDPPIRSGALGETRPVGARADLAGREHIIMTAWGPYDYSEPMILADGPYLDPDLGACMAFTLLGARQTDDEWPTLRLANKASATPGLQILSNERGPEPRLIVNATTPGAHRLLITADEPDGETIIAIHETMLIASTWTIVNFPSPCDPRKDIESWRAAATGDSAITRTAIELNEHYATGSPGTPGEPCDNLPADHFGTIATTELELPAGDWIIRTVSDDGVRVHLNDELVIDDWTWHPPVEHEYAFTLDEPTTIRIRIEHFELDGFAVLAAQIAPTSVIPAEAGIQAP